MIERAKREEQERIARDLHDQVGQDIACIKMGLHFLRPHVQSPEGIAKLQHVLRLTDGLDGDLRQLIYDVRLAGIEAGALVPMLRAMTEDWSMSTGIEVQLSVIESGDHRSAAVDTALYRVCQECLTNISKHASAASRVSISLRCTKKEIMLSVADDGAGFAEGSPIHGEAGSNQNRYGIVGMRERLAGIGGTMTITSVPSVGTQVVAKVPLREG